LLGDIDGDGVADLIVFRAGTWYVSTHRNGVADRAYRFGQAGDTALAGDFNGDGIADLALYRGGLWYIDTNRDGTADIIVVWGGAANDLPVTLDYDGDGRADIAVFRDGLWYVNRRSTAPRRSSYRTGAAGDRPLPGSSACANTRFVRAGGSCLVGCTAANPYATITAARQDAVDGDILRVAPGTYAESLDFSYPGNQYMPGKFGKNNIKLIGASKYTTIVLPPAGDALYLRGASATTCAASDCRRRRPARAASCGRRHKLGAPDVSRRAGQRRRDGRDREPQTNALLTGSSNAWFRYVRLNRSRAGHGISGWGNTYVRIVTSEISNNGYAVAPAVAPPDSGKGSTSVTIPRATPGAARCAGT
jgi:hypothetical protein